jgi:S1-C subfamily serine protease
MRIPRHSFIDLRLIEGFAMLKNLAIGIAAATLVSGTLPETARAQEASTAQESEKAIAEARDRLEEARREVEQAAREVAELSGRNAGYAYAFGNMHGPWRAELGVTIEDSDNGVRVMGVTPGGPAAAAGVEVDDVITAIDSTTLPGAGSESARLIEHLRNVDPGQAVKLHVERDGAARDITVATREAQPFVVWTGPDSNVFVRGVPPTGGRGGVIVGPGSAPSVAPRMPFNVFLGGRWNDLELVTLTPELGSYFGATDGLLVVRAPDEPSVGLQEGDVILDIAGREPTSPEHAMRILMSFEPGETVTFSIMRRQRRESVEYTIPGSGSQG